MGGEIVVQEELSAEEEERHIVHHPNHDEEAARIPQTMSDGCKRGVSTIKGGGYYPNNLQSLSTGMFLRSAKIVAGKIPKIKKTAPAAVHQPTRLPTK